MLTISKQYSHGLKLITKYVFNVFPAVNNELADWKRLANNIPDPHLRHQALSSLEFKKFHAQGGSVYALYPGVNFEITIKFIVAFQTISDYLDNLCDRAGVENEKSFRRLHLAMLDAVDLNRDIHDYYSAYPFKNDGGYLNKLVMECRKQLKKITGYSSIREAIIKYVELYSNLQSYKHLSESTREPLLASWSLEYQRFYPDIYWWEFSAATGSTLAIFLLVALASNSLPVQEEFCSIDRAYFPWICGLHILLDYYIDSEEDLQTGDLNFTYYYNSLSNCSDRLNFFIQQSINNCLSLSYSLFHLTVIKGLLAMYLSDKKALTGTNKIITKELIKEAGPATGFYYSCCRLLRYGGIL